MCNSYRVELTIRFQERKGECGSYFSIITQSFKFDGKIKPLLNGKKKQFGLFALVTPVNPANPFTSTPKELLQLYSCKMGLDLRVRKLDTRCVSYLNPCGRNCSKVPYKLACTTEIPRKKGRAKQLEKCLAKNNAGRFFRRNQQRDEKLSFSSPPPPHFCLL